MGSAPVAPPGGGTLNAEGQGIAYAPTSAMPQAAPGGFAQPVAQPPGAPPPGFPAPPVASPEIADDYDAIPTNPMVATGEAPQVPAPQLTAPVPAPASGALNSQEFVDLYKQTLEFIKPVWIPAALILGSITVPIALASGLLGLIPWVGPLLVVLLALGQAVLMPLAVAALHRFLLGAYLNHPVDWMNAWKEQIANAKMVWLSFFVAGLITFVGFIFLIIPGILLGSFVGLIYFCEGKRMVDINLRNLEIAKQEPLLLIISLIAVGLAVGIGIALPFWLLSIIPWIGGILAGVFQAAVMAIVMPFIVVLTMRLYFQIRRRFEGGEPEIGAMQMLIATTASLPQETGE